MQAIYPYQITFIQTIFIKETSNDANHQYPYWPLKPLLMQTINIKYSLFMQTINIKNRFLMQTINRKKYYCYKPGTSLLTTENIIDANHQYHKITFDANHQYLIDDRSHYWSKPLKFLSIAETFIDANHQYQKILVMQIIEFKKLLSMQTINIKKHF